MRVTSTPIWTYSIVLHCPGLNDEEGAHLSAATTNTVIPPSATPRTPSIVASFSALINHQSSINHRPLPALATRPRSPLPARQCASIHHQSGKSQPKEPGTCVLDSSSIFSLFRGRSRYLVLQLRCPPVCRCNILWVLMSVHCRPRRRWGTAVGISSCPGDGIFRSLFFSLNIVRFGRAHLRWRRASPLPCSLPRYERADPLFSSLLSFSPSSCPALVPVPDNANRSIHNVRVQYSRVCRDPTKTLDSRHLQGGSPSWPPPGPPDHVKVERGYHGSPNSRPCRVTRRPGRRQKSQSGTLRRGPPPCQIRSVVSFWQGRHSYEKS